MPLECFWWFVSGVKKIKDKWCRLQCYSVKFQTNFLSIKAAHLLDSKFISHRVWRKVVFFRLSRAKSVCIPPPWFSRPNGSVALTLRAILWRGDEHFCIYEHLFFLYDSFISPWELKWRRFYLQGIIIYAFIIASAASVTKTWWYT